MMIPRFLVTGDVAPDFSVHPIAALPDLGLFKRLAQQHLWGLQGHFLWRPAKLLALTMILEEVAVSCHYYGEGTMDGLVRKPLPTWSGWGSQRLVVPDVLEDLPLLERLS